MGRTSERRHDLHGPINKRVYAAVKEISKYASLESAGAKALIMDTKKSILEQMIEAVILLQWAEREGIEIKDKTVKARIAQLKKSFPSSYEFHKSLAEQGMTPDDLERDIKRQIIVDKLMTMRANALAVSDEEIKAYYDRTNESAQKEKLHLMQLTSKDENEIKTAKLKIEAGGKVSGEDIGIVERGQLPVSDDSQIFALKKGEVSNVISGEAGYYIFIVVERFPEKETKFEDVKDNIRKFLLKEKSRTQYMKDLDEEKSAAKIILNEKLAKMFYPVTSQEAVPLP
jgi:peptidyl-prolyl cis-trans isomerase C